MVILILGPLGSGKGVQASALADEFNLYYFESGNFLRELAKKRKDIDEKINIAGKLLGNEEMFMLVKDFLEKRKIKDNIVFDGFPRSIKQYELLKNWYDKRGTKIDLAIDLLVSRNESLKRLSARRIDSKTGEVYNLVTDPPPAGVNPKDLIQRDDDRSDAIKNRLLWYQTKVKPLLNLLKKQKILVSVNGERSIETIRKDLKSIVEKVKSGKS